MRTPCLTGGVLLDQVMGHGLEVSGPRQHMLMSSPPAFLGLTRETQRKLGTELVCCVPNVASDSGPFFVGSLGGVALALPS